ncbi:MAG: hypothetical protein DRP56_04680 [Planctomycetota bacterium]|nr:MAG: hypothetical protein DRP56_04680 [Planctomycetota bacterium]
MKILVEVTHPAHVHFFRNAITVFEQRGHTVEVTTRNTGIIVDLLKEFRIPFTELNTPGTARSLAFQRLLKRDYLLWKFCKEYKPDVLTGIGGVYAAHVGKLIGKPSVIWDDTEHYAISHKLTWPFASVIQSPDCYLNPPVKKQRFYPGCHELAYLHPDRFVPDIDKVRQFGIDPSKKYCVVRFSSFQAQHDIGQHGFSNKDKVRLVHELAKHARPYITSEGPLLDELKRYQIKIPIHQIHHVMAFACLCVTEGATMASESALLGVPTVYVNTLKLGYINMLEGYGLIKQSTNIEQILQYSLDFLTEADALEKYKTIKQNLLKDKIDVTQYIVDTVEHAVKSNASLAV